MSTAFNYFGAVEFLFWMMVVIVYAVRTGMAEDKRGGRR
jgi:hypothetical protein